MSTSDIKKVADSDGHFRRQQSQFRSTISSEPGAEFPPEKDRYVCVLCSTTARVSSDSLCRSCISTQAAHGHTEQT